MRKYLVLQIIILMIMHSCASSQSLFTENIKIVLDDFTDSYYNHYYTLPRSLDTVINIMESRVMYVDSSVLCNYNETLEFLKRSKQDITWILKDEDFMNEELVVIFDSDTILHKINHMRFPCLGMLLEEYRNNYLEDPISYDVFMKKNLKRKYFNEPPLLGCDSVTLAELKDCYEKNRLFWQIDDNGILIKVNNDTIVFTPPFSACNLNQFDKRLSRFYDIDGNVIISNELDSIFNKGISELKKNYPNIDLGNELNYTLVTYTINKQLIPYCEDGDFDIEWLKTIENYANFFTTNYNVSSLTFGVLPYHK